MSITTYECSIKSMCQMNQAIDSGVTCCDTDYCNGEDVIAEKPSGKPDSDCNYEPSKPGQPMSRHCKPNKPNKPTLPQYSKLTCYSGMGDWVEKMKCPSHGEYYCGVSIFFRKN